MKRKKIGIALRALFLLMVLGCGQKDAAFKAEYDAALGAESGQELFNALIRLDQKYQDRLEVKVDLGAFLLVAGDGEKARIYLESAEKLAGRGGDAGLKALLFTNLAELSYRDGKYGDAVRYADSALALNPEEPLGVVFTRAKARYVEGKNAEALADFDAGWETARSTMIPDDFRAYSALLVESSQPEKALEVLKEYQYRFVYETGTGLTESVLLEKLGRIEESILCAFKELEYQRYFGALTDESALANLGSLNAKLTTGPAKTLTEMLRRFISGDWKAVINNAEALEQLKDQPFAHYVMLASRMEESAPPESTLSLYLALEPHFRGMPGFYYHLWRGMKAGSGEYSKETALPVLEKCILLAPGTRFARESRREIGALLGLSAADGEKILLGAELDEIAGRVVTEADLSALEPVFSLLAIPDNAYEMAGVLLLKRLVGLESVRELVRTREKVTAGKLKERLTFVLSG